MENVDKENLDGTDMKIAIIVSRFNESITDALLEGAMSCFVAQGVLEDDIQVLTVPGAFEIPQLANHIAAAQAVDGVLCLGAVIRGETPHFDYVCNEAARGCQFVSLTHGLPVSFGVLTTDTVEQAQARAGGDHGNKGEDCALTLIEMVHLMAKS